MHPDNGILGACAYKDAEYRKVRLLKKAGFNAIRLAHNLASSYLLDACDYYGMYIFEDAFDQWVVPTSKYDYARDFTKDWRKDINNWIRHSYNHPSVIMYSIGNEISETAQSKGLIIARQIIDLIRSIDDSRPITSAVNIMLNAMVSKGFGIYHENQKNGSSGQGIEQLSGSKFANVLIKSMGKSMNLVTGSWVVGKAVKQIMSLLDIAGYNYGLVRYKKDTRKYPNRVMLGTETFAPQIYENWKMVKQIPAVIGDFIWTGWDYIGEAGFGAMQYSSWNKDSEKLMLLNGSGIIDLLGNFRPEVWLTRAAYNFDVPAYLAVEPLNHAQEKKLHTPWRVSDSIHSWAWRGYEGILTVVKVYSNADHIDLYLNGKKVGSDQLTTPVFNTPIISAKVSRSELHVDQHELSFINLKITDKNNNLLPLINPLLQVKVTGPINLLGFGSANPRTCENFTTFKHHLYRGHSQLVVTDLHSTGTGMIKICGEGLQPRIISIKVN